MTNAYEASMRMQILKSDRQQVKLIAALLGGEKFWKVAGDLLGSVASGEHELPSKFASTKGTKAIVWVRLPKDSVEALKRLRDERADATWAALLHYALQLQDESRHQLTAS